MTNKVIEALTDGSLGEDFWIDAIYRSIGSSVVEELAENTGLKLELDKDGTLVVEGSIVRLVDAFRGNPPVSDYWIVLSVEKDGITRYVRNDGWYNSYEGGRFSEGKGTEVFPFKKIATSWSTSKDDPSKSIDCS